PGAARRGAEFPRRLEAPGAEVVGPPAITIEPVRFDVPDLDRYRWLVFTSANGVAAFFGRGLAPAGLDARALAGLRLAAIGPGTPAALAERGLRADLLPHRFLAAPPTRRVGGRVAPRAVPAAGGRGRAGAAGPGRTGAGRPPCRPLGARVRRRRSCRLPNRDGAARHRRARPGPSRRRGCAHVHVVVD